SLPRVPRPPYSSLLPCSTLVRSSYGEWHHLFHWLRSLQYSGVNSSHPGIPDHTSKKHRDRPSKYVCPYNKSRITSSIGRGDKYDNGTSNIVFAPVKPS